ncbi:hypothetical protein [Sulfurirhabdus autotrophica]|uniref:Uncharacterized protein n=1 Tax=Sulfurirhabdus autotrophica TaxID=1706046 RepID=A0A4R3YH58_9PROT|nr:hypothetical protein [Sulfurirhabdus autotrophica]TCV90304.1 hypothetical protein EDC63_101274 [Sulfurirhabdus autotrophica]
MKFLLKLLATATLALPVSIVWAQTPDPADANAAVPPYVYKSSFSQFFSYQESDVQDWTKTQNATKQNGEPMDMGNMKMPATKDTPKQNGGKAGHQMHNMHNM